MSYPRRNAATQRFTLGAPRNFIVSRSGEHILFCRSTAGDDPINRLWILDLPHTEPRLLVDPVELLAESTEMTAAERARRERAREAGGGIVTYTTHSSHGIIVFALGQRLFRTDYATGETTELNATAGAFDPRIAPDGMRVAYHANGALYVTGDEIGDRAVASEPDSDPSVAWGIAEFVAAEEMGRGRGHWWSPDSDRLLVARVDTSAVATWHISEPVDASVTPRPIPYPAAGETNATVDLFIVGLDGSTVAVDWRQSEHEYLTNASWTRTHGITLTVQPRDQKSLVVLSVDADTGAVTELHRQTDPGWVELLSGVPKRTGDLLVTVGDDHDADTRRLLVDGVPVTPAGLQVRGVQTITKTHAVITATEDSTEVHVWRVTLDGSGLERLSEVPGVHRWTGNDTTQVLISSTLADTQSTAVVTSSLLDAPLTIDNLAERPDLNFNVAISSATPRELRTAVVLPSKHDGTPLPVLLDPYGGPHALRVLRARAPYAASQWFADQGFAVVITDGSGTPARGPSFEQEILGDLATTVLDDQVAALHATADQHGDLFDMTRVGIRGWSFGGYLAALAVLRRPDVFHAAVAGAPVTDWKLYDTHYTERYMGHPEDNPDGYASTNLSTMAADLTRPLMLIHGLADDNVVAAHTFRLSRALLEAGRPHEVLPLSGVSHMTPQESVAENLLLLQVAFLKRALAIDQA